MSVSLSASVSVSVSAPVLCLRLRLRLHLCLCPQDVWGGSIDIYKCFDQINRELLKQVAITAGMPGRIAEPYFRFIADFEVRYQIGSKIGKARQVKCSIPQGCPFSMTMVALLMTPCVKLMRDLQVDPRVLADDLLLTAQGKHHRSSAVRAMRESRKFFSAMGARIDDNKCFTFSAEPSTRTFLNELDWDGKGFKIPNVNEVRDLGAHLNLHSNSNANTNTKRFQKATEMAKRLEWLNFTRDSRIHVIKTNILPLALYGSETGNPSMKAMRQLRSAIADAIGSGSSKRSVNLTFDMTGTNKDLDPVADMF